MDRAAAEGRLAAPPGRFAFGFASEADDAALRAVIERTPMAGPVRLVLRRDPSYFRAAEVEGPGHRVFIARDSSTGRVVGMGSRSVRERYVDGTPTPVGYLGGLRIVPECRGGSLLARGYRMLRATIEEEPTRFDLTTIAEGNRRALETLPSGRAGLPTYHPLGRYFTFVLPLRRRSRAAPPGPFTIRPMRAEDLPALIDFLRDEGARRLFFPCYTADDFTGPRATFATLPIGNILGAWDGPRLVGTLAAWDQTPFRQSVVAGYSRALSLVRPAFNRVSPLLGWPRFPAVGEPLRGLTAALPIVARGAEAAFPPLLEALRGRGGDGKHDHLMIGAATRDPILPALRRRAVFTYVTRVYLVSWPRDGLDPSAFEGRPMYLELGCL